MPDAEETAAESIVLDLEKPEVQVRRHENGSIQYICEADGYPKPKGK